jgi:hypothetical protein
MENSLEMVLATFIIFGPIEIGHILILLVLAVNHLSTVTDKRFLCTKSLFLNLHFVSQCCQSLY